MQGRRKEKGELEEAAESTFEYLNISSYLMAGLFETAQVLQDAPG
jgi:hypothetical protein